IQIPTQKPSDLVEAKPHGSTEPIKTKERLSEMGWGHSPSNNLFTHWTLFEFHARFCGDNAMYEKLTMLFGEVPGIGAEVLGLMGKGFTEDKLSVH
ncbi:hypothetical protein A6R68_24234, partial [Neotoma lepida]